MKKPLIAALALCAASTAAMAQSAGPPTFLQGQPLSSSMLNNAFKSVVRLNGISMVGACIGNSSPSGNGSATITVSCPGAGFPNGANGAIQINNGGLFQGVTMTGDASMDSTGLFTLNTVPVSKGGTGATTATVARVNLGISTVGSTGAYADLTGLPTLGTIAATALPAGPLVGSNGAALTSIPAISGDATLNVATGVLTLSPVAVPKGGTGAVVFGAHQVMLGQGTASVTTTAGGVATQVLTSNGPDSDPTWQAAASGGTGLSPIANNTLLGNTSGFSANPVSTSVTAMLDTIGATQGSVLERGASGWQPIVPGTAGNCYTSNGPNADPTWQSCAGGTAFSGTGGVVGVDANGQPFIFSLNNLTVSTGTGSGILSAGSGGGGGGGGGGATEFVNPQTSTTYTVVSGDATTLTTLNNASAIAVTLPQPGSTILSGWFADYSNIGAGPATFTPTISTVDGLASIVLYPGQGIRIVSDGTNYFTQRGGMIPAQVGPLINVLTASGAAADADTFPVVQGGTTATKQNLGAIWTWVGGHLPNYKPPQVVATTGFTLDANTHNGKIVTVTSPLTISLPSTLAAVGVGFKTAIFNQSGGAITLSNAGAGWGAWATSSGSLSIPNGQVALVTVLQPVSAGVVYADISNTGAGGGGGSTGFPRVSGRYYAPAISAIATGGVTSGRLYAMPMRLRAGTYRGMAFAIAGGPTSTVTCRQALYSDVSGAPGAVLAENVASITSGTTGALYNDFTGGDYTAATDVNVWVASVCGAPATMTVYIATASSTQPYVETQMGSGGPVGVSGTDAGIYSSTITTYPATTLALTNSGNFGAVTYSGSTSIPVSNVRAR